MIDDLTHGGSLPAMRRAFPSAPLPWLDLSTGINPRPYPVGSLPPDIFHNLPDSDLIEACRAAMADAWSVASSRVVLSPGSEAAIHLLPRLIPARRVGIVGPTYGDHARAWSDAGAEIIDLTDLPDHADGLDVVVLVCPNNPDGRIAPAERLDALAAMMAIRGGRLIVDEAFADLEPSPSIATRCGQESLVVLRSFGKFFGLAGIRLGAIVAHPTFAERAASAMGSWPVSGPALLLGAKAYRDQAWTTATRASLATQAARLDTTLTSSGLSIAGGTSLFRYVSHNDAHGLWRHLAAAGIYVRRFAWSANHLRIGLPRSDDERDRLKRALRSSA